MSGRSWLFCIHVLPIVPSHARCCWVQGIWSVPLFHDQVSPAPTLSCISLSCFCVSQHYLDLSLQGLLGSMCGAPGGALPRTPQYTPKNEGIPRRAGDALWSAVPPLPAQSMASGSSTLGVQMLGVWFWLTSTPKGSMVVPVV